MIVNSLRILSVVRKPAFWQWMLLSHIFCIENYKLSVPCGGDWRALEMTAAILLYCR